MSDIYLLDTSFLINGWVKRYRPTVFPTVWTILEKEIASSTVISCQEVFRELEKGKDDLLEWAKLRKAMFHRPTENELIQLGAVMGKFPNFAAKGGSTNRADPFVIAHAITNRAIVVTDELNTNTRPTKPPKIPVVCEAMNVPWMSPIDFLQSIGVWY